MRAQCQPRHHTQAAATSALESPKQVRICAGVGDPERAIGTYELSFEQICGRRAIGLGKAAEATALYEPRHTHGQTTPALDVASCSCGNGLIDLAPSGTGPDRDRWLRLAALFAAGRDESLMKADRRHFAGPNEQRVRRVGGPLIAVSSAFDHNAQRVGAGKIDGSRDVICRLSRNGKDAGA